MITEGQSDHRWKLSQPRHGVAIVADAIADWTTDERIPKRRDYPRAASPASVHTSADLLNLNTAE